MFFASKTKTGIKLTLIMVALLASSGCGRRGMNNPTLAQETISRISGTSAEKVENQYIIKKKGLAYIDESFAEKNNLTVVKSIPSLMIDIVEIESEESLENLRKNAAIEFVEPNYIRKMKVNFGNSNQISSESVKQSGIEKANTINRGKPFVTVAVLGTGVDSGHPDLKGKLVDGYSTFGEDDSTSDINGSGTHQAGVIVASNRSYGVTGVAPNCRVMPIKAMNQSGEVRDSALIEGIVWAAEHGAGVITFTAEGKNPSKALDEAIKLAFNKKVPVVVGAGDSSSQEKTYPAASAGVIAVSALGNNSLASFANYGPWTSVSAPGLNIMSTVPTKNVFLNNAGMKTNYASLSGSFVSAAYVAGNIALIRSQYSGLDMFGIKTHLEMTSDDLGAPGPDPKFGYGRINAAKALMFQPPRR